MYLRVRISGPSTTGFRCGVVVHTLREEQDNLLYPGLPVALDTCNGPHESGSHRTKRTRTKMGRRGPTP